MSHQQRAAAGLAEEAYYALVKAFYASNNLTIETEMTLFEVLTALGLPEEAHEEMVRRMESDREAVELKAAVSGEAPAQPSMRQMPPQAVAPMSRGAPPPVAYPPSAAGHISPKGSSRGKNLKVAPPAVPSYQALPSPSDYDAPQLSKKSKKPAAVPAQPSPAAAPGYRGAASYGAGGGAAGASLAKPSASKKGAKAGGPPASAAPSASAPLSKAAAGPKADAPGVQGRKVPFNDKLFAEVVERRGKLGELEDMLGQLNGREAELCRELRDLGVGEGDPEAGDLVCALVEYYRLEDREQELQTMLQAA